MNDTLKYSSTAYEDAPLVSLNLGTAQLTLSLPAHQARSTPQLAAGDINIFDDALYQGGPPPGERYIPLVSNTWNSYLANSSMYAGSLHLIIAVVHALDEKEKQYNFLQSSSCAEWIVDRLVKSYAPLDRDCIEELQANGGSASESNLWIYPKKVSDLKKIIKDGMHWYSGYTGHPSMGEPQIFFRVPLEQHYALEINIHLDGFNPEYFDSQETIAEIKTALLQEFLQHIHITHPPEILAQVK